MELLALVHQYGLSSIEKQISTHLCNNLALEHVVSVLNVAVLYNIQELSDKCLRFLDKHSADFLTGGIVGGLSEVIHNNIIKAIWHVTLASDGDLLLNIIKLLSVILLLSLLLLPLLSLLLSLLLLLLLSSSSSFDSFYF